MSYTYPSRPTVAKTGRGRGTSTRTQNQPKMQGLGVPGGQTDPTLGEESGGENSGAGLQERIQRRDAYSVISPNEKKRAEIARKAKQEEVKYKQYQQTKKLGHVSYVGTAGGGEMTETQARKKLQQKQNSSAYERRMKSQQYKEQEKQRENDEIEKKKAEARRKAEKNKETEAKRQNNHREDHRRTNEAFLARFEREAKEKSREKRFAGQSRPVQSSYQAEYQDDESSDDEADLLEGAAALDVPPAHSTQSFGAQLRELQIYFPNYDTKCLEDILLQVNGDIDMAKDLLSS